MGTNKLYILILILILPGFISFGKASDTISFKGIPGNTLFIELGGSSFHYSVNYERKLFRIGKFSTSCRIGIGYIDMSFAAWEKDLVYPMGLYGIWQCGKRWFAEIGPGISFKKHGHKDDELEPVLWRKSTHLILYSGIRYAGKRGLMLRAGFSPSWVLKYSNPTTRDLSPPSLPFAGISVGFCFGK